PAKTHQTGRPYELIQGQMDAPTIVTEKRNRLTLDERATLFEVAYSFNEHFKTVVNIPRDQKKARLESGELMPGEAYDATEPVEETRELLIKHGWQHHGNDSVGELWTRPGKHSGISARLFDNGCFYVFSSNAHPFDQGQTYSPFAVLAMLEHDG